MGQFSWIYADTHKQMIDDKRKDSYLLIPPKFQRKYGKSIVTHCYDGYGRFGEHDEYDVYALVAEFNRDFIPDLLLMEKRGEWNCPLDHLVSAETLLSYYSGEECEFETIRSIGITMACYDDDNARLPYPIKITEEVRPYEWTLPSDADPDQGWESDDGYNEEWDY